MSFKSLFFPHDDHPDHFKPLDGLRGVALLLVLFSHSSKNGLLFHEWLDFSRIGKSGIYMFFVLSAYLLDRQIALALRSGKSNRDYWINYFLRRFMRIFPLFFIALWVNWAVQNYGYALGLPRWQNVIKHLLFMEGHSVFWSVPVEFKYYFLSPLWMYFCHRVLRWKLTPVLVSTFAIAALSVGAAIAYDFPRTSTIPFLSTFLVGTALSVYELVKAPTFTQPAVRQRWEVLGYIGMALVLLTNPTYFSALTGIDMDFHDPIFYLPFSLLWAGVLMSAKHGTGSLGRLLSFRFLRFLGAISFSAYLFHMPLLRWVQSWPDTLSPALKLSAFLTMTVVVASISYLLLERNFYRFYWKGKLVVK